MNSKLHEEDYSNQLLTWNLRRPVIERALSSLSGLSGRGLDIGCGIGLTTRLLEEISSADDDVTGLDISPSCIETACTFNSKSKFSSRVHYQVGDVLNLQWDRHTFNWAGCIDLAGMKGLNAWGDGQSRETRRYRFSTQLVGPVITTWTSCSGSTA